MNSKVCRIYVTACTMAAALIIPGTAIAQRQLSLPDAIGIARQQSYDAMVARLHFMSQYWSYRSFKAELMPSVNLHGNLLQFDRSMVETRNFDDGRISYVENNSMSNSLSLSVDQNIVALGGKLSVQSYLYRLDQYSYDKTTYNSRPIRLSYTQPLRAFNLLKWQKKTEPLKYEQAKRVYLEALEEVNIEVVRLFFNVLSAQSVYRQSLATKKDRDYLYEIAKKRHELGTVTKSEILQLELSKLNAEVEVTDNQLALENSKFNLFSYLRVLDYKDTELLPPYSISNTVVGTDDVIAKALENSSHDLQQKVSIMEARQSVAQAKANKGLQMQLSSEIGFNRTADTFKGAYSGLKDNEIIGLSVSLPIFDWGVSKGRVKMAEADLEATKTLMEQAHESYLQSIKTCVLQFNSQAVQCKNALRALDIADERYDITKRRFETGAVSVTELNTAQQEADAARAQYVGLLQSYWSNYYQIQKTTLYDWERNRKIELNDDIEQ
ncbi:MAG: TolC family protein [Prevotella sp.]|nr:TolC family protein [Prevotella sp.]